jgi:cytochrome P450
METRVVLTQLLDRLPNLRLDPEQPAPQITGMVFRAPPAIHVVWD